MARARLQNQWRRPVTFTLLLSAAGAAALAVLLPVLTRLVYGQWGWPATAVLGAAMGLLIGFSGLFSGRYPIKQQEIELRADDFTISGTRQCTLRYDTLRGYSIIRPEDTPNRVLILYPIVESGQYSIGIPDDVADAIICDIIASRVPFVSIIDEQALKFT
jgi:hypothetical protein